MCNFKRIQTKLEGPITINEPFNLVVFVSRVKFGIHFVTLNFRTKTSACKYSTLLVLHDFH